jgi:hypothetical protein
MPFVSFRQLCFVFNQVKPDQAILSSAMAKRKRSAFIDKHLYHVKR